MKKSLLLIASVVCLNLFVAAQTEGLTWPMVKSSVEKSDKNIENPKKNTKSATWVKRFRDYMDLFTYDIQGIQVGMDIKLIPSAKLSSPISQRVENGYNVVSYDRIDFLVKDGKLDRWVRTEEIAKTSLLTAIEAAKKAKELDPATKFDQQKMDIANYYARLVAGFRYDDENYDECLTYFKAAYDVTLILGQVDTILIKNCGLVAKLAKQYDEAIFFLEKAEQIGGGAPIAHEIAILHLEQGDTAKALTVLKTGVEKYKEDATGLLIEMINIYLKTNEQQKALEYLDLAIKNEPTNASYYFAKGVALGNMQKMDEAEATYKKGLEIDSNNSDINFNLGALYNQKAAAAYEKANKEKSDKLYAQYKKEAENYIATSIPYLEKVLELIESGKVELTAENIGVYEVLKESYGKLNMMDKYNGIKQKIEDIRNKNQG